MHFQMKVFVWENKLLTISITVYFPVFLFVITISSSSTQNPNPVHNHYLDSLKEDSAFLNQILQSCPLF